MSEEQVEQSSLYRRYLIQFPDSHIARDVQQYGSKGMMSHGGFGTALREGRYEDAMYAADWENIVKLEQLGIINHLSPKGISIFLGRYAHAVKVRDGTLE